jgi:chromosome segregation ATPase
VRRIMAEIQRYTPVRTSMFGAMAENLSGEYVTHADHLATLAAKDAEWQKVLSQSISTSNANVAAAQDEIERLKADVDALAQQLENGEEMYIAMRERCAGVESHLFRAQDEYESLEHQNAALREQLATRTAPVSDEEWRLTGSGIGNQTVAWRFEVDRLLAARDKADDAVKENNGNA